MSIKLIYHNNVINFPIFIYNTYKHSNNLKKEVIITKHIVNYFLNYIIRLITYITYFYNKI